MNMVREERKTISGTVAGIAAAVVCNLVWMTFLVGIIENH